MTLSPKRSVPESLFSDGGSSSIRCESEAPESLGNRLRREKNKTNRVKCIPFSAGAPRLSSSIAPPRTRAFEYLIVQRCDKPRETLFARSRFRLDGDVILELPRCPSFGTNLRWGEWVGGPVELSYYPIVVTDSLVIITCHQSAQPSSRQQQQQKKESDSPPGQPWGRLPARRSRVMGHHHHRRRHARVDETWAPALPYLPTCLGLVLAVLHVIPPVAQACCKCPAWYPHARRSAVFA